MSDLDSTIRVLLLAEEANPEWQSVPLVGWSHARAISGCTTATLVTQIRNRDAILRAGLVEGRDFHAIDSERIARPIYKLGSLLRGGPDRGWTVLKALAPISYQYFERLVWQQFGPDIRLGKYDIVHRLSPLSPTTPSLHLAAKCARAGVPFVVGPLNGGVPWPRGFGSTRRQENEWLAPVRGAYRMLPGYRSTRRDASAILIASSDTWKQLPATYRDKSFFVVENAIDPDRFPPSQPRAPSAPMRALFVGRLVPYKGADMLLEAAAPLLKQGRLALDVVGDGPQLSQLLRLAAQLDIEHAVRFLGRVPHEEVHRHFLAADLFTFPSIREFGGGVVLEAMAMGAVPVVVHYGGPADLVTNDTAISVELGSREQIIRRFRAALEAAVENPDRIAAMSQKAEFIARIKYTWSAKAEQVLGIYRWLLGRGDKPILQPPMAC